MCRRSWSGSANERGSAFTLAAAPLLPWLAIAAARRTLHRCVLGFGILRRARGVPWRAIALAILLAALVNPSLVEEQRSPQRDVAIIVVDESPSQRIGDRQRATEAALAALSDRLARERDLDVRVVRAGKPQPGAGDDGTRLFTALDSGDVRCAAPASRRRGHDHRRPGARRARAGMRRRGGNDRRAAPRPAVRDSPMRATAGSSLIRRRALASSARRLQLKIRVEDLPRSADRKEDGGDGPSDRHLAQGWR